MKVGLIQIVLGLFLVFISFFLLVLMWSDGPVSHNVFEYLPGMFGILSIVLGVRTLIKKQDR